MEKINHRDIQLIANDLTVYGTTIAYESVLPEFITDRQGRLFQKVKMMLGSGQSRVNYYQVRVTNLSNIEITNYVEH